MAKKKMIESDCEKFILHIKFEFNAVHCDNKVLIHILEKSSMLHHSVSFLVAAISNQHVSNFLLRQNT